MNAVFQAILYMGCFVLLKSVTNSMPIASLPYEKEQNTEKGDPGDPLKKNAPQDLMKKKRVWTFLGFEKCP